MNSIHTAIHKPSSHYSHVVCVLVWCFNLRRLTSQFDLFERYTQHQPEELQSQPLVACITMFCCFTAYLSAHPRSLVFALQPLGSLPHVRPHGSVRLSGGGGTHLGDPARGLQEDPLPGEPVRPVRPELLSPPPGLSDHSSSLTSAGWARDVCSRIRMRRTREQTTYNPPLLPSAPSLCRPTSLYIILYLLYSRPEH